MLNEAVWVSILKREAKAPEDFWNWSKVCKGSAAASRTIKHLVAARFKKLNTYRWGWSYSLDVPRKLLHGSRGVIDVDSGFFEIQFYAYGQPQRGRKYTIVPYREPSDLSTAVVKHIRELSDHHVQQVWRRFQGRCIYPLPDEPPPQSNVFEVKTFIEAIIGQ